MQHSKHWRREEVAPTHDPPRKTRPGPSGRVRFGKLYAPSRKTAEWQLWPLASLVFAPEAEADLMKPSAGTGLCRAPRPRR